MADLKNIDGIRKYISDIRKILKPADKIYDTGSGILDVILNEKYGVADQKGIKFKVIGTFEDGCGLDPMSISVIFANLIDNAIEACDRMKDPSAYKRVQITFYQDNEDDKEIFILVENTCDKGPIMTNDKDEIVTSKEDKKAHGIGLQSVKSEVKKYGGKLKIETTDGSFRVTITIPIK
jgi:sensor histidine kinase regulating citrate/malate metabolism